MELKDFVKESIVHISKGIDEANTEFLESETHAMVNPFHVKTYSENAKAFGRTQKRSKASKSKIIETIEFDVAVVAESGKSGAAGAKLSIASIGIGGEGKAETKNKSESRIRFSIPVVFPGVENEN